MIVEYPLATPHEFTGVFKFQSLGQGKYIESAVHTVKATSMPVGTAVELVVPNKTLGGKGPDPDEAIYKTIKDAKRDDLLKVKCAQVTTTSPIVIESVEPYTLSPGEDKPGVYIFKARAEQKVGNEDHEAIVVHKYLQETTLLVPARRDDKYKLVPDTEMMKVIDSLAPGDSVEIKSTGQVLTAIRCWASAVQDTPRPDTPTTVPTVAPNTKTSATSKVSGN